MRRVSICLYCKYIDTSPKLSNVNFQFFNFSDSQILTDFGVPASRRAFRYIFARSVNYAPKGCRSNP